MLTLLFSLSLTVAATTGAAPAVAVDDIEAMGLQAAERAELEERLGGELELMGATVTRRADEASASIGLKVTRVGPLFLVVTIVRDRDGSVVGRFERQVRSGALLGSLLLGPGVARALEATHPALRPAPTPVREVSAGALPEGESAGVAWASWSLLAAGASASVVGAGLVLVGSVGAAHEAWVLSDRVSLGVAKARARVSGPGLIAAAGLGAALALGGTAVAGASLLVE